MTFKMETTFAVYENCVLYRDEYSNNGHIYIGITDEEGPIADLTVNVPDIFLYPKNCSAVDTNNLREAENVIKQLGIGKLVGFSRSGFYTYPVYEFDVKAVNKYV